MTDEEIGVVGEMIDRACELSREACLDLIHMIEQHADDMDDDTHAMHTNASIAIEVLNWLQKLKECGEC